MASRLTKSVIYIRKLSVFFLFLAVFAIFFSIYYYKFIPDNRDEFKERGFRILNQLANNIIDKNREIKNNFLNIHLDQKKDECRTSYSLKDFADKNGSLFEKLNENLSYDTFSVIQVRDSRSAKADSGKVVAIDNSKEGQIFNYLTKIKADTTAGEKKVESTFGASINSSVFLNPILETRKDLFDTYMLLLDEGEAGKGADSMKGKIDKNKNNLRIIYQQDAITSSTKLNIDSLSKAAGNTDYLNVVDFNISGIKYKVFFCPFVLNDKNVLLAGFVSSDVYEKKIRATPQGFIPIVIIIIMLILISLPFIKIFSLSPKENIGKRDVLFTTLSIFLGSSLIVMIGFYLLINYCTHQTSNQRLKDVRAQVKKSIDNEFGLIDQQLAWYDSAYQSRISNKEEMKVFTYQQTDEDTIRKVDSFFIPTIYKNVKRVLWIDSAGNTLVKWNPFDFNAPLTKVDDYDFFKMLNKEKPNSDNDGKDNFEIVYPGKSNVTGEFQVYVAKPNNKFVLADAAGCTPLSKQAYAIVMAVSLDCSEYPILPPGFEFCLIDNEGKVLIHSDKTKNLSENIITETTDNERLQNCIKFKNDSLINDVSLYGESYVFGVLPIKNQPLNLVVYYNRDFLFNNTLRLLHFSVESLIYTYLVLVICIIFSTGISYRPPKLRFNIYKTEWVRPAPENKNSYRILVPYFSFLLTLTIITFGIILGFNLGMKLMYYVSLLLPVYAVFGFIASRKSAGQIKRLEAMHLYINSLEAKLADMEKALAQKIFPETEDGRRQKKQEDLRIKRQKNKISGRKFLSSIFSFDLYRIIEAGLPCFVFISLFNMTFLVGDHSPWKKDLALIFIFQVIATGILLWRYNMVMGKQRVAAKKDKGNANNDIHVTNTESQVKTAADADESAETVLSEKELNAIEMNCRRKQKILDGIILRYKLCLHMGMILISILPAVGIVVYGYQSEKIQFKKNKLLNIAAAYEERQDYVYNELAPDYKEVVRNKFEGTKYLDSIKLNAGVYLTDKDIVTTTSFLPVNDSIANAKEIERNSRGVLCDGPYATMMDNLFLISALEFKNYSVKNKSQDSTWSFDEKNSRLTLLYKNKFIDSSIRQNVIIASTAINNPLWNFNNLSIWLRIVVTLLILVFAFISNKFIGAAMNRLFLVNYMPTASKIKVNRSYLQRFLKFVDTHSPYLLGLKIEPPLLDFVRVSESSIPEKFKNHPQEYILAVAHHANDMFIRIWKDQSASEQYFLFDFSCDGYANYKDMDTLNSLVSKGILTFDNYKLELFSPAFRNFLISKRGTPDILKLKQENAEPGLWETIRIPVLVLIAVTAIFLFITQQDFSHQLTAIFTSIAALIPLVMKLFEKLGSSSGSDSRSAS